MKRPVRLPLEALRPGVRALSKEEARYLIRVRRLTEGDAFVAFDPKTGLEATGRVTSGGDVHLDPPTEAPPEGSVTWIHALAKGDKCDAIVRDATELGATRIVFTKTARSVVDLDEGRTQRRGERFRRIADEAARQSERRRAPELAYVDFEELLATPTPPSTLSICLYEEATRPLAETLSERADAHVFFAGPEGGFNREEIDRIEKAGFDVASLGPRILRTETVPAAVLGAFFFGRLR